MSGYKSVEMRLYFLGATCGPAGLQLLQRSHRLAVRLLLAQLLQPVALPRNSLLLLSACTRRQAFISYKRVLVKYERLTYMVIIEGHDAMVAWER